MHLPGLTTTRLHLLIALAALLTGTTYGVLAAVTVLAVTGLRHHAQSHLETSVPGGARVLPATQHAPVLDATGRSRERLAG
ncbi:hypothetical protein [Nocardioides pantholopis]|uniref:hypothetical protein n=1 Tax=Nocardioides pantholopis TaxID=2483798 RepID=UPI000FDA9A18|nr:hypothetical protein [Nocardioides pantholopis]